MRTFFFLTLFILCSHSVSAEKPNILFIMVDDLGKEWISCYGAEGIETPGEQETLLELGITYGQGYLFAKAKPDFVGIEAIPVLNDSHGPLSVSSG